MKLPATLQVTRLPPRPWLGAICFYGWLLSVEALAQSSVQCCKSLLPEVPPATAYGATIYRDDDARGEHQPYQPILFDATLPAEKLSNKISSEELQQGAYSAGLIPDLQELGAAHFQTGRYRDAIAAYAKAIHLLRVNEGLNTISQAGLVEQVIEAHLQMGDTVAADKQQSYLFRIRQRAYPSGSAEMLVATQQFADWQRAAYISELDRYKYPRIVDLFDLYDKGVNDIASEKGGLSRDILPYLQGKLKVHYLLSNYSGEREDGMRISINQNDDIDLPSLKKLRFKRFHDGNYRYGKQTIQKMRDILTNDPETRPGDLATAQLALADWYQWHHHYAEALQAYKVAWEMMSVSPRDQDLLVSSFAEPLELPEEVVFHPGRMAVRRSNVAEVTIRFGVSRLGEAKDIQVVSPSSEENQPAVTRAHKYLRDMRFRPRLVDGEAVESVALERSYTIHY
ncbi:MAG: hypothetical protein AAGI44_13035 [Pseudomonadota bacterium]